MHTDMNFLTNHVAKQTMQDDNRRKNNKLNFIKNVDVAQSHLAYYGKRSLINNTWCLLQFHLYCRVLYCVIPWKLQERFLNNKGIYKR